MTTPEFRIPLSGTRARDNDAEADWLAYTNRITVRVRGHECPTPQSV